MKNNHPNKKSILLKTVIILIVALICIALVFAINSSRTNKEETPVDSSSDINFGPPTEQEQNAGNEQKEAIEENENTSISEAEVIITDASQYNKVVEVRSFISNVIEDGTCTVTFTKEAQTVTRNVPAKADASTTTCISLNIESSEFPATGVWSVNVTYSNENMSIAGEANRELEIK